MRPLAFFPYVLEHPAAFSKRFAHPASCRTFTCTALATEMVLTAAQLQEYAGVFAEVRHGGHWSVFTALARRDLVQDEWQREFQRVMSLYRRDENVQRCISSRVHRHYMSCAQEAHWFTQKGP